MPPSEVICEGCGKKYKKADHRFDHLMYFALRQRHYNGPVILAGWVCNEVCAARTLAKRLPYLCDQCDQPATTSTWVRLQGTEIFVRTKRCDDHPFQVPEWVKRLRRPPRRPTRKGVAKR